ncbi:MAG: AI-2E family transporter [Oscillospiraceae bacterium]
MQKKVKDYFTNSTISNILTVIVGVVVYLALSNFTVVKVGIAGVYKVISPFVIAFMIAFVLNTPVNWFETVVFGKFKKSKAKAITTVYIIAFVVCGALFVAVGPQIVQSITSVLDNIPKYLESINVMVTKLAVEYNVDSQVAAELEQAWKAIIKTISSFAMSSIPALLNVSVTTGSVIINGIMAIIASIYMLMGKATLIFQIKKLLFAYMSPDRAQRLVTVGRRSNLIFSKFINGKMLDSLIIGIICFVGTMFIYSPYALLLAVIIGVTNMIPFFGPFIGAIPAIFILLMVKPMYAFIFAIFVLVLQQFDGNILGPKILGDSTGLSAIWVLVAIVVGGGLFGFPGMLIGVPTFAVLYGLVSENIDKNLVSKNIAVDRKNHKIEADETGGDHEASL